jgi:uncharacterized protein YkwD
MPFAVPRRVVSRLASAGVGVLPGRRVVLVTALSLVVSSAGLLAGPPSAAAWSSGEFSSASEQELIARTNQSRANAGLRALKLDPGLTAVARWRSKDMINRDYFSHDIPGVGSVFDELSRRGYCFNLAGENIGWNNYPDAAATEGIHQMFLDSPSHRSNIMGTPWDVIGIGAYKGPTGKKMWTVLFADACGGAAATPKPTVKPAPKPTPKPTPRPTPRPSPAATPTPTPRPVPANAAPAPRATPDPTPRLTPRATPRPTTEPTRTPTPTPTPTTRPIPTATSTVPPVAFEDPLDDLEREVGRPDGARSKPPGKPRPALPPVADAAPLRISEPAQPPGLLDSIVGGVTGPFFGG